MRIVGTVREFRSDEGWGVIDSDETPGGCWVGFATINMMGFHKLTYGDVVTADVEEGPQDGYNFRATEVWPGNASTNEYQEHSPPSTAYGSRLTITDSDDSSAPEPDGPLG